MNSLAENTYLRWLDKLNQYAENSLNRYYDEFFTVFVGYNILYVEASKILVSQGQAKLNKYGGINDSEGATTNIIKFLTADYLTSELLKATEVERNIDQLVTQLNGGFYVRNHEWDKKRIDGVASKTGNRTGKAVLELIYGIRCNMFHGGKNFEADQKHILISSTIILRKVNELLFRRLEQGNEN